ncbi:MAG: Gfo/Idh/MocA family oxidoreductase [Treponema sp.]|nr:Gfo/Idh/MocA family oxidoreductase [Treponema sp.]
MKETINIGIIGLGNRGRSLMETCILPRREVKVAAVCDVYEDRRMEAAAIVERAGQPRPFISGDYKAVIGLAGLDAVLISTGWTPHVEIACAAMKAGLYTAVEVAGAFSIDDCWRLVHIYEETGAQCMFLENCCFGRYELMVLNMVRQGIFGEIVHCAGGYRHDLRMELADSPKNRHYRLDEYLHRNCENYPTHELGPIAEVLDINRGNRMLKLNAVASKAAGLGNVVSGRGGGEAVRIAQGDIVTTVITCARGETIVLTLDTTLPRSYSRGFEVRGTRGMFFEDTRSVFLDSEHRAFEFNGKGLWGNADSYFEKYEHPIWKQYIKEGVQGGHDGMDWLEFSAFFKAVREGSPVPIDVYDMASWMSITPLSEDSVAMGGMPVPIPDFTNGRWIARKDRVFRAD